MYTLRRMLGIEMSEVETMMRELPSPVDACGTSVESGWIRLLFVDSRMDFARLIQLYLQELAIGHVVGDAGTQQQALDLTRQTRPNVIVTAVSGLTPFEWIPTIVREFPETHVLVWTGFVHGEVIRASFESGAIGYLSKPATRDVLIDAICAVAAGETFLLCLG